MTEGFNRGIQNFYRTAKKNFTLVAILPAEPLDDYLYDSCFWCVHCRILFLFSRFMMPEAFNIGSLSFNADCVLVSIRNASGIFHLLKYGLLAYFDLTSRTMARGWRRYDGWPRKIVLLTLMFFCLISKLIAHNICILIFVEAKMKT